MSAREPTQVVELYQPRCSLTFGAGACTATGDNPCYQTWTTCPVRQIYDGAASIRWRFVKDTPGDTAFGEFDDPDNIATNGIVGLVSVSTSKASMNVGGVLEGKSAFGTTAGVTVVIKDGVWDDYVGDPHRATRPQFPRTFWPVWNARNAFYGGMYLIIYDGFVGQTLAEMRQRKYVLDKVDGPDASGKVTLTGVDPLRLTGSTKAEFPRTTDIKVAAAFTEASTSISVRSDLDDINDLSEFGNAAYRLIRIGNEVIRYNGFTEVSAGVYRLTGLTRGFDNTTASSGSVDARAQRCGRFENLEPWRMGKFLMQNATRIPAEFFDFDAWEIEGDRYLSIFKRSITIAEVNAVDALMGEICQQGMFNIWWNEDAQTIPMLAIRPPRGEVTQLTYDSNILAGSAELRREPKSLITRAFVYYGPKDPTASRTQTANYQRLEGAIELENESENAAGGAFTRTIYARFIETEAHAFQLISRLFLRYGTVPRFLSIRVSEKDRVIEVGQVTDVLSRQVTDADGRIDPARWQVTSFDTIRAGEVYLLDLQSFDLLGRYGNWMGEGAPDYLDATDEQRANGMWWAGADGKMSDGSDGYRWQ